MSCFNYLKTKKKKSRSAPELKNGRNPQNSGGDRVTKSSGSAASQRTIPELYEEKAHNLRVFSFSELRNATNDFNRLLKIGEGGFGSVYKGSILPPDGQGDKIIVAVKKLRRDGLQGHKQWVAEVQFLGVVEHPNLVKLIGYCAVDGERGIQRLLVYEFMRNKSLEDHLFSRSLPVLPWITRLQILLGAAQGLTYLHEGLEAQVVGTYGYAAPDYVETGHLTTKSDVWSFGVVLYEALSGRRSLERNFPKTEQKLLEWVKKFPPDSKKFHMIMDPRLGKQYSLTAARRIAKLADSCLSKSRDERPDMSEVVESLKQAIEISEAGSSEVSGVFETSGPDIATSSEGPSQVDSPVSAERRMNHLAKLKEKANAVGRRRFTIMERGKLI